ncbi:MAG: hypothetical protein ACR2JG_00475 [Geodermatophilaceae bacterium]
MTYEGQERRLLDVPVVELPDRAGALAAEPGEDDDEDEDVSEAGLDEEPEESLLDAASLLLDDDSEELDEESDELPDADADEASVDGSPFFLFLAPLVSARESLR